MFLCHAAGCHDDAGSKLRKASAVAFAIRNPQVVPGGKNSSLGDVVSKTHSWTAEKDGSADGELDFATKTGFPTKTATQTEVGHVALEAIFVLECIGQHGMMDGINRAQPAAAAADAQ